MWLLRHQQCADPSKMYAEHTLKNILLRLFGYCERLGLETKQNVSKRILFFFLEAINKNIFG